MTTVKTGYAAPTVASSLKARTKRSGLPLPPALRAPVLVPEPAAPASEPRISSRARDPPSKATSGSKAHPVRKPTKPRPDPAVPRPKSAVPVVRGATSRVTEPAAFDVAKATVRDRTIHDISSIARALAKKAKPGRKAGSDEETSLVTRTHDYKKRDCDEKTMPGSLFAIRPKTSSKPRAAAVVSADPSPTHRAALRKPASVLPAPLSSRRSGPASGVKGTGRASGATGRGFGAFGREVHRGALASRAALTPGFMGVGVGSRGRARLASSGVRWVSPQEEVRRAANVRFGQDERAAVALTRELDMEALLTPAQSGALKYVQSVASHVSEAAKPNLLLRCKRLGFSADDMEQALRYIRLFAPIIVHIDLDTVLEPLMSDRYLRNQFETKTSKGAFEPDHRSRMRWEHVIFRGLYDKAAGYERPKYGSINITNDPAGVHSCAQFGDSYLLLRNVRFRTTFCDGDSSNAGSVNDMATCEHYAHVLNQYDRAELAGVLRIATQKREFLPSVDYVRTYKEAQIPGPIRLNRDVEAIVVHPRHAAVLNRAEKLAQFALNNNCTLLWIKPEHIPPPTTPTTPTTDRRRSSSSRHKTDKSAPDIPLPAPPRITAVAPATVESESERHKSRPRSRSAPPYRLTPIPHTLSYRRIPY
jgi:hypothetical protein